MEFLKKCSSIEELLEQQHIINMLLFFSEDDKDSSLEKDE